MIGLVACTGVSAAQAANYDGTVNAGEVAFYYSRDVVGSRADFNTNVPDFGNYHYLTAGAGQNQGVRNNAASVWNNNGSRWARTFYSPNYAGVYNTADPNTTKNFTVDIRNNNASFSYVVL